MCLSIAGTYVPVSATRVSLFVWKLGADARTYVRMVSFAAEEIWWYVATFCRASRERREPL